MVIQRMGREAVLEQAVRDSLPEWYEEAILRSGVSTVGDPKLDLDELPAAGEPLSFSIEVGGHAEGDARHATRASRSASASPRCPAEAVDQELERLRERFARVESVDRPLERGRPSPSSTSSGSVDGEPFQGGEARDYMLEIGGGRLIEGFEEQLVGAQGGRRRARSRSTSRTTTRPRSSQGKHAVFEVEVKDVKQKELPELDDDFASEASEFDTLDELRADIEHKLEHAQEHSIEDEFREAAVDAAVGGGRRRPARRPRRRRAPRRCGSAPSACCARRASTPRPTCRRPGKTREEMVEETKEDAAPAARARERARGGRRRRGDRGLRRGAARGARSAPPSARAPSPRSCSSA